MNLHLRGKLLLPTILLVVIGMVATAVVSYTTSSQTIKTMVVQQIDQIAHSVSKNIDAWIKERRREVKNWSETKVFQSALKENFVAKSARKSANTLLARLIGEYNFLESINLTNKSGEVVSSSNEKMLGAQRADRQYIKASLAGKDHISQVIMSRNTGQPAFVVSSPVKANDEVLGVIYATISLAAFNLEFIDPVKVGATGYAFMMAPDGRVIAYPDKKQILKMSLADLGLKGEALSQETGLLSHEFEGDAKLLSYRRNKTTSWLVLVVASENELFEPARRIGYINLGMTAAIVIMILLAMSFLTNRLMARPLGRAVAVMKKLSQGNLQERVDIDTGDEVGELSRAVDSFTATLTDFSGLLKQVGQGDLTLDAPSRSEEDELSPAVQQMIDNLRDVVMQVNAAASQIANGSNQIADSSQSLSQGATQQAASLEEITSSMTEIGSQTNANAENANHANQLAQGASEAAEKGNQQMNQMITAMVEISDSSKEIAKIIKTIDDIAFQTNLLALNAAVEAARAGKHGKGFAVVAQEVRNLASRSAKAAQETSDLIESSVKKVENGSEIVNRTAGALSEIVDSVTKVTHLVGEIAAASNEQAQGITQVNQGLTQVEQVTQQNTASAEETASAAEELAGQSGQLRQILNRFALRAFESPAGPAAPPQPATPKQLTAALKHESDNALTSSEDQKLGQEDVIALNDSEFGKY